MEIEYSSETKAKINDLLEKEKQSRQINDAIESVRIIKQLVSYIWELGNVKHLQEVMISLSKKRG